MKFTYTKANGDVSLRNLVVIRKPSKSFFGIDVSDIDADKAADLEAFISGQNTELSEAIAELGLANKYRTFLSEGVSFD